MSKGVEGVGEAVAGGMTPYAVEAASSDVARDGCAVSIVVRP